VANQLTDWSRKLRLQKECHEFSEAQVMLQGDRAPFLYEEEVRTEIQITIALYKALNVKSLYKTEKVPPCWHETNLGLPQMGQAKADGL